MQQIMWKNKNIMRKIITLGISIGMSTLESLSSRKNTQVATKSNLESESIPFIPNFKSIIDEVLVYPTKNKDRRKVSEGPKSGGSKFIPLKSRR